MRNREHSSHLYNNPLSLSGSSPTKPHPQPLSFGGAPSLSLGQTQGSNFVPSPSSEVDGGGVVSKKLKAFPATGWTRSQYSLGFTLVELIVVVTILTILATIGFVSYSSYLTGVRDTNRIAQMTSLSDGLNLYSTRNDLPIPEDNVEVSVNGNLIAYQGYAGANILETINFEKGGVDPKDNTYFSYYLTRDRKYFQLMGFLEESADLTTLIPSPSPLEEKGASIVSLSPKGAPSLSLGQTQGIQGGGLFGLGRGIAQAANYQNRIPTVTGKKLGILTDLENNPVQEAGTDIDITSSSTEEYKAYLTNDNILEGQGSTLVAMNPKASCRRIRETTTLRKNGVYTINPDGTEIEVYCDMTTDGGGWTLVLKADGNESTFNYSSSYWTTSNILNEDNFSYNTNEFKSNMYNTQPFEAILIEFDTNGVKQFLSLDVQGNSLLEVLNGPSILTNKSKDEWLGLVVGSELQTYCNAQGINPHLTTVRIGMTSNNETTCSSNDSALGMGMNSSATIGNYCNSTLCNGKTSSSSLRVHSFGYLYIR